MILVEIFPELLSIIFILKSFALLLFLLIASIHDVLVKRVPDGIWFIGFASILPTIIFEIFLIGFSQLLDILISFGFFFLFSLVCFSLRFFGGADCKAFLFLSILFPFQFTSLFSFQSVQLFPFSFQSGQTFPIQFHFDYFFFSLPFSVLSNSLLLSLIFSAFYILIGFKLLSHPIFFKRPVSFSSNKIKISISDALKLRVPFLPSITFGFILALCDINLFFSLFSLFSIFFSF
ncbi:hypothetical protein MmiHf6_16520 [Methanimicrococcus hongohii]|uniref:Prepilin type IV endopeptidase peptidase domain-containing protein n=1 Tax=Methanimicrococcus hongohii TaxID=3028295 RepID=A0AA96ZUG9_9EURY|nr:hypothetical protein MmiHf6_16520 [Methanimicrococcus sp. Hf6]